ncbi:rna-directed dna polymerase from mobile element jockey-like [Limosa lapponica baueri]|uniref:Rna-directed dna polymerase from mobile element jockey-like n=1 Tax=Limosa lapponica baueri TaxID=1758121 RepID=A0A2I0TG43_LIMLA|nr:rna-directed dna polymerase from mobile element jockey-like [Limosa lapponica baueri]
MAAIQKDLERLNRCANGNLMKFSKRKHRVLHLKYDKHMPKGLGADWRESRFAENVQGGVGGQVERESKGALASMKDRSILDCISKRVASRLRDSSALVVTFETTSGYCIQFGTRQRQDKKDIDIQKSGGGPPE